MTPHPISKDHPDFKAASAKQKRCRDACSGSDAIKSAGTAYLPALSTHKDGGLEGQAEYEGYLCRALWYNASRRTRIGLSGSSTIRPPKETAKAELTKVYSKRLVKSAKVIADEVFEVGRVCILVNQQPDAQDVTHSIWWAESIRNWRYEKDIDTGDWRLAMLVLEDTEEKEKDVWDVETVKVRHGYVLKDGVCVYSKFTEVKDGDWQQDGEDVELASIGGRKLDHVPAIILGPTTLNEPQVEDPLLLDLVDVNISHYQNSADLEHGRHWTALPTAWASGFPTHDTDGIPVTFAVGGKSAWITEIPGAQAGYLEFSGSGLGHLAAGMAEKRDMMAVLGARLLEEPKSSVEAAETLKTRLAGERSVMARVAKTISDGLTWALREMMSWKSPGFKVVDEEDDRIDLQADIGTGMTTDELAALTKALQAGGISYLTYFQRLQQGEIIPMDRTVEEESAAIDAGAPGAASQPDPFMQDPNADPNADPNLNPSD